MLPAVCSVCAFVAFPFICAALLSSMCLADPWELARLFQLICLAVRKVVSAPSAGKYLLVCCYAVGMCLLLAEAGNKTGGNMDT